MTERQRLVLGGRGEFGTAFDELLTLFSCRWETDGKIGLPLEEALELMMIIPTKDKVSRKNPTRVLS